MAPVRSSWRATGRAILTWFLDEGWFSRCCLISQFAFVWWILDWSMAFASTALTVCVGGKCDLMGAAANIAAVAAVPQALLMLDTNKYMEMRTAPRDAVERKP